jgi:hypothetical protein
MRNESITLLDDHPDQVFFVSILILGALLITLLKSFSVTAFVPVFFSITLIVTYCYVSHTFQRFTLPPERIGDNAYYLGFLFTLISLSNALYHYADSENASKLIADFGVALGSTISGVVARTVFHQLRLDVEQIEFGVRESLTESAMNARAQIENLNQEITLMVQELTQTVGNIVKQTTDLSSELAKNNETMILQLGSITKEIAKNAEELEAGVRSSLGSFPPKLDAELAILTSKINGIEVPSKTFDELSRHIKDLNSSLADLLVSQEKYKNEESISYAGLLALYLKSKMK